MKYSQLTAMSLMARARNLPRTTVIFLTGAAFGWLLGMITMALAISQTGG